MGIILQMDDFNNVYISLVFLPWNRARTMKLVSEIREIIPVWDFTLFSLTQIKENLTLLLFLDTE